MTRTSRSARYLTGIHSLTAGRIGVVFTITALLSATIPLLAQQRFSAKNSSIAFYSDGILEDITAVNRNVTSIFDVGTGDVAFLMNVNDFQFANKLMQAHFNEKYMETDKFPKASFQGTVTGFSITQRGTQPVRATGKLTLHGVTREVQIPGSIEVADNKLTIKATFIITLADYDITVPRVVWEKVAQQVEVTVESGYSPL